VIPERLVPAARATLVKVNRRKVLAVVFIFGLLEISDDICFVS
jgi:hypothetical protein